MSTVLIVSPHFPPTNAADMHRVRMALPYLSDQGWQAEVLAVEPSAVAAPLDQWMAEGLPPHIPIHRVRALGLGFSVVPGLGTLGFRALPAIARKGHELLAKGHFDLVYFSTTQWPVHLAGPRWKKRHGVPFAMDYQDPWVNDYYRRHPEIVPPGGRLRYGLAAALNRWMEPRVLGQCSGYTAVSEAYPRQLRQRYSWAAQIPDAVIPFPGSERDFARVKSEHVKQTHFDGGDGKSHWVYVGRGGQDMETAARALFAGLAAQCSRDPSLRGRIMMHFIGTSYAPAGRGQPSIAPIARHYGLEDLVKESPDRIPYSETLRCLSDADAILALCSDDPAYTASKIYPCILARKPLLVICRRDSGVAKLLEDTGGGTCATFDGRDLVASAATTIEDEWLCDARWQKPKALRQDALAKYLERESARKLTSFWDRILVGRDSGNETL